MKRKVFGILAICLLLSTVVISCEGNTGSKDVTPTPTVAVTPTAVPTKVAEPTATPTATTIPEPTEPAEFEWPTEYSLKEAYADDFLIGTIYTDALRTGKLLEIAKTQFNVITPENLMKPGSMQPTEGKFNFAAADNMMEYADIIGVSVVGHTLCWHQQSGPWLGVDVDRETAIAQLKSHIMNVAGQYKDQIISWDVVNEAIRDGATLPADGDWTKCLRETQWTKSIGPDYLEMAFQFAREAAPNCKLYYNDYNMNNKNKADIAYAMVKDFIARGIPIDGIGMQGHYNTDTSIGSVEYSLGKFSELGIEISVTELDVCVSGASSSGLSERQEIDQAVFYAKLFSLYKEYADSIARVTFWGHVDAYSWRADRFPCLYNKDYTPKLAVYAVLDPDRFLSMYSVIDPVTEAKLALANYGTPVIDGEMDGPWGLTKPYKIDNQLTAWEGATGTVRMLWDETTLYAFFDVKDSKLDKSAVNAYQQDSVELFLDQNNAKSAFYQDDDGQYRVNYNGDISFGSAPAVSMEGFRAAAKVKDGGYVVEMAIPLVVEGKEGILLGFDAQVNDAAAGVRQAIAKFNDLSDNSYNTTENYANVKLMK